VVQVCCDMTLLVFSDISENTVPSSAGVQDCSAPEDEGTEFL
jgi:hypothetical protein